VTDPVRAIADAVLYEGYVLWPYRRSALKNQRRWTFGCVFPEAHAARHPDDRAAVRAEVLLEGGSVEDVDVRARFLHVVHREVLEARADGWLTWDEAAEREVGAGPFAIPAGRQEEPGVVRTWSALSGVVDVTADGDRIAVTVSNTTPWDGDDREAALHHACCSLHVVLRARSGRFVSATAFEGDNEGLWPVLVGDDTVLASPIILDDHPRIAPESPGDLFDGGEIDQMLVLNILTLTEEEKAEMRASDPRTREILERTEALTPEDLSRLGGAIRDLAHEAGP
jgi:hypothetical protein